MKDTITIAADDFGLTRSITDTILQTVDAGPVTHVSVIPNGEAVEYAIEEYKKRSERLTLAAHLNLTEDRALSDKKDIPLLVDGAGNFKYGIAGLWAAYLTAGGRTQSHIREQIRKEITAQITRIREASGVKGIAVNGHQHVHLIPFVFDELLTLPDLLEVRTIREPFQWTWSPTYMFAHFVLALLSNRAAPLLRRHGIRTNESFIGFMHSGHMTEQLSRSVLRRTTGSVEALFHPGSACKGELTSWQGNRVDIGWHYSPWRAREREMLLRPDFLTNLEKVLRGP